MKCTRLLLIFMSLSATAFAQLVPGKDLGFAQIAFGGGYETVLNVSNRGTSIYNGTLALWPTDRTKPFPALVNGSPVPAPFQMTLALNAGATASLRITSGNVSAGTLTGFATIIGANREADNLLEGNLTYYVKSADGTIVDSIGVAPSRAAFQATVPFDDFQTVALALANLNFVNATTTFRLTLFDENNTQVGNFSQSLGPLQQLPRFLPELFPGVSLTKGRVDINSGIPLLGTALTFVKGGQASSLPFLQSTKLYNATLNVTPAGTFTSHAYVSFDGPFVTLYTFDTENGIPQPGTMDRSVGLVTDGTLEILSREGPNEISSVVIPNFNPQALTQTGTFTAYSLIPGGVLGQGTVTLTMIR
jgi:hypothetical protein